MVAFGATLTVHYDVARHTPNVNVWRWLVPLAASAVCLRIRSGGPVRSVSALAFAYIAVGTAVGDLLTRAAAAVPVTVAQLVVVVVVVVLAAVSAGR